LLFYTAVPAQGSFETRFNALRKLTADSGVVLTFDEPEVLNPSKPTRIIVYALPNGNTTAQTFGKKPAPGDDWHFDIQHIGAQTAFIRKADPKTNYIVVYVENTLKSWPAWRRKYADADLQIGKMIQQLLKDYAAYQPRLILSGHSGGGSFIFGYMNAQDKIPPAVERIGFLDATYAYETEKHALKLNTWIKNKHTALQVIAYNDSVVVYNGKPLVSPTGGTWYRSKQMAADVMPVFSLTAQDLPDRLTWQNRNHHIAFNLIKNPEALIYHTVLVEKNGFIHLVLNGTPFENKGYRFWADRAYSSFILE